MRKLLSFTETNPNILAIKLVDALKGNDYLIDHVFEPSRPTTRRCADAAFIETIRGN